jgi:hypothetical protein
MYKLYKLLNRLAAWGCMVGICIYLPIMSYREIVVSLTDKAIIVGIMGIFFYLESMRDEIHESRKQKEDR